MMHGCAGINRRIGDSGFLVALLTSRTRIVSIEAAALEGDTNVAKDFSEFSAAFWAFGQSGVC